MKYRTDILALYGDLFDEAHTSLEKYAFAQEVMGAGMGLREIARRVGAFGSRVFGGGSKSPAVAKAVRPRPAIEARPTYLNESERAAIAAGRMPEPRVAAPAAKPAAKPGIGAGTVAAVGIPAAGVGGYMLGAPDKAQAEAERTRTRNIAFGAGAATGLAAPYVIRGIGSLANGIAGGNQGLYPGMAGGY